MTKIFCDICGKPATEFIEVFATIAGKPVKFRLIAEKDPPHSQSFLINCVDLCAVHQDAILKEMLVDLAPAVEKAKQ